MFVRDVRGSLKGEEEMNHSSFLPHFGKAGGFPIGSEITKHVCRNGISYSNDNSTTVTPIPPSRGSPQRYDLTKEWPERY
jgi:hypothetical protein